VDWKRELKILAVLVIIFLAAYSLPLGSPKVQSAIYEAFLLLQWYARNHTLACVVPALFIAGAIITFLSKDSVIRYLGPSANPFLAYAVASVAGCVLAVCSCSVLPMFAGIYQLGAGLGPASAFLYSGPAINVLALFLSARVLGLSIGLARAIGAVLFAVIIGLSMAAVFRKSEKVKARNAIHMPQQEKPQRDIGKTAIFQATMVLFLVFSDWFNPGNLVVKTVDDSQFKAVVIHETKTDIRFQLQQDLGTHQSGDKIVLGKNEIAEMEEMKSWVITIYKNRGYLSGLCGLAVLAMAWQWFQKDEIKEWMSNTWQFTKLLVPLLFGGVFIVGFLSVLLPEKQVAQWVGDNSIKSNLVASVIGAFWYFATLTEIPITQALMKLGMHEGPVLALLLAGPALSLPNILVIRKVMGNRRTVVFILLVVIISAAAGMLFGAIV